MLEEVLLRMVSEFSDLPRFEFEKPCCQCSSLPLLGSRLHSYSFEMTSALNWPRMKNHKIICVNRTIINKGYRSGILQKNLKVGRYAYMDQLN